MNADKKQVEKGNKTYVVFRDNISTASVTQIAVKGEWEVKCKGTMLLGFHETRLAKGVQRRFITSGDEPPKADSIRGWYRESLKEGCMSKTLTGHTLAWRLSTVFVNLS
jgi:hypothetical protein